MLAFLFVSLAAASVSTDSTGFVPSDPVCAGMKAALCADADCMTLDVGIMQVILQMPMLGGSGDYLCPLAGTCASGSFAPAFAMTDETSADVLATFAFAVSVYATAQTAALTQIHPALNAVYECEARAVGLVWADHVGTWTIAQSCMNDAACMTALTNIRTVSSNKDEMSGFMNKKTPAVWDEFAIDGISLLPFWLPNQKGHVFCNSAGTGGLFCNGHEGNDNDQLCNVIFAAMVEENVLAMTWIATAAGLMFNSPNEILADCNSRMTGQMSMLLGLIGSGAAVGGVLLTAITCCCIKRSSKQDTI